MHRSLGIFCTHLAHMGEEIDGWTAEQLRQLAQQHMGGAGGPCARRSLNFSNTTLTEEHTRHLCAIASLTQLTIGVISGI